jgi:hypothetical protein
MHRHHIHVTQLLEIRIANTCPTADPDPYHAPNESDANLRPLPVVYRPSTAPFQASTPPLCASKAIYGSILSL